MKIPKARLSDYLNQNEGGPDMVDYKEILKDYPDILLPDDVQKILQTGRNTVYLYLANGTIRSLKIGGKYRIPKIYLMEFIYPGMKFIQESE